MTSVYFSGLCVSSSSSSTNSSSGGSSYDSSSIPTGCPDISRVNLDVAESAETLVDSVRIPGNEIESACFSQWTCVCVKVEVDVAEAVGVMNNGTHGAMVVRGNTERAEVR